MPIPSRVYALWRQTQLSVTRKPMSNNPLSTSYTVVVSTNQTMCGPCSCPVLFFTVS